MVHKKYTYKNGKRYGPYLYENKRVNGKVQTRYLGSHKETRSPVWLYVIVILVVALAFFVPFPERNLSGRAVFDFNVNFVPGELITGTLKLNLKEGELIPLDSTVSVSLGDATREFVLSDLLDDEQVSGAFYIEDVLLEGSGAGYGVQGSAIVYPDVDFDLAILEKESSGDSAEERNSENNEAESNTENSGSESVDVEEPSAPSLESGEESGESTEDADSTQEEMDDSEPIEVAEDVSEDVSDDSSAALVDDADTEDSSDSNVAPSISITGAAVSTDDFVVSGSASHEDDFTYSLSAGQTARIVSESVSVAGEPVEVSVLDLDIDNGIVTVSTEYSEERFGFGEMFLGEEELTLSIDLMQFDFIALQDSELRVVVSHGGTDLITTSRDIFVDETLSDGNESNGTSVADTAVQSELAFSSEVPLIRMNGGGTYELDLTQHFVGADRYELVIENIAVAFTEDVATLTAESDFKGARKGRVIAYADGEQVESNEFTILVSSGNLAVAVATKEQIVIGKPVKWVADVSVDQDEAVGTVIELPEDATNVVVQKVEDGVAREASASVLTGQATAEIELDKDTFIVRVWQRIRKITGFAVESGDGSSPGDSGSVDVVLEDAASEYVIEYETQAPQLIEAAESDATKTVIISAPDELGYTDVLSFTNIPEILSIGQEDEITVYWREDSRPVPFDAYDLSGDGLLDYVEWITPHLSNQTFDIILITDAQHLNASRDFISNIFDDVFELDGNWSETIPANDYVRVTFEINLTSTRDITVYPRTVSGAPRIEIYEIDGNTLIAEFSSLNDNVYNKVYLDDLVGEQDTFDLLILDGDVEFDHIIDPQLPQGEFFEDCTNILDWTVTGGWTVSSNECRSASMTEESMTSAEINLSTSFAANLSFDYNYNQGFGGGNFRVYVSNDTANYVLAYEQTSTGSGTFEFDLEDNITFTDEVTLRANCTASSGGGFCIWDNINITSYDRAELTGCAEITEDGATLTLQNDLSSNGTCFDVNANNVVIDGNGYSITGNGSGFGVDVENQQTTITLLNVTITNFSTSVNAAGTLNSDAIGGNVTAQYSHLESIDVSGSDDQSGSAFDAGFVVLIESNASTISANAGSGSTFGANGGDAGDIRIENTFIDLSHGTIQLNGGTAGIGGAAGSDGRLTLNYSSSFDDTNTTYVSDMFLAIINSSTDGGQIEWLTVKDMDGFSNLSAHIQISDNFVSVDSTVLTILNASANVSLFGSPGNGLSNPILFRNDIACAAAICHNFTALTDATVVFNVSYWTNYSVGENFSPNITECSTLSQANTVYTVQNNISTTGTCFTITASNVTLNGAGFTIDGDDGTSDYGIDVSTSVTNVTVSNLSIEDFGAGVYFVGASNSFADTVRITSSSQYGVRTGSTNNFSSIVSTNDNQAFYLSGNRDNYIRDSVIENSSAESITVRANSDRNNFINVSVNSSGGDAIVLERVVTQTPDDNVFTNMTVSNTAGGAYDLRFIASGVVGIGPVTLIDSVFANYSFDFVDVVLTVEDTAFGQIYFFDGVNGSGINLTDDVFIGNNLARVASIRNVGLNKSANVSLYGTPGGGLSDPQIFRDQSVCSDTICSNFTSLTDATVVFNVSYWTNYSISELQSCLNFSSVCSEGNSCTVSRDCLLNDDLCSDGVCDFTNFTTSAMIHTDHETNGNAKDLTLNLTGTTLFLPGNVIEFSGQNRSVGGNGSTVNITTSGLFNRTNAVFIGLGGFSSLGGAVGGDGGNLQYNYHGLIGGSSSISTTLTAGNSTSGSSGSDGSETQVKDGVCPRDADITDNGVVTGGDITQIVVNYNDVRGEIGYNELYDINCDDKLNIVDLTRISFEIFRGQ